MSTTQTIYYWPQGQWVYESNLQYVEREFPGQMHEGQIPQNIPAKAVDLLVIRWLEEYSRKEYNKSAIDTIMVGTID